MDTTALFSDVVLPAASYYEKSDISTTDCHSYIHPFNKVLDPLYDSKPDWEIFRDLAKKVAQLAAERKLAPYHDQQFDWHRDFTKTYDLWSGNGKFQQPEDGANFILDGSPETKGMTFEQLKQHPQRFKKIDEEAWNSEIKEGQAYTPFQHQVDEEAPVAHPYRTAAVLPGPPLVPRFR